MEFLGSECSSGCESGWTLYLEQSFVSHGGFDHRESGFCDGYWKAEEEEEEEEEEEGVEEDLSMVSDASSGPPHLFEDDACSHEDDDGGHFSLASKSVTLGKKQKIEGFQCHDHQPLCFLDDTASSPAHNFTANNFANQASMDNFLGFSQTSHFEERTAFTEHFGFLQSSLSGNRLQKDQSFEGKGIGMR